MTFARLSFAVVSAMLSATAAAGNDIDQLQNAAQSEFRLLSEDLGAALGYKLLAPAEPLGLTGFDIGMSVSSTKLENITVLEKVTSSDANSTLVIPRIQAVKGLPLDIDVGVSYSAVPSSNIKLVGFELKYAVLSGGVASPAVAVRGSVTKLSGVEQLDLETRGIDISASKGFANLTPYFGVGSVWVTSTPKGVATLTEEDFRLTKYFGGVNVNFGLINVAVEADKTGDASSYGLKLGWRF